MKPAVRLAVLVVVIVAAVITGRFLRRVITPPNPAPPPAITPPTPVTPVSTARGEVIYLTHCAKCHGPEGHGDGEAAEKLRPPPRDFAKRPWRFEITAFAIRKVTYEGIPGTGMPAAKGVLNEDELAAVTAHVLKLSTPAGEIVTDELDGLLRAADFSPVPHRPAPPLTIVDADGVSRSLADERGHWVVLNFWGTSCESCLRAMPSLKRVADARKEQGLVVLPICADTDDIAEAKLPAEKLAPGFKVYVDDSGIGPHRFEVKVLPTTWLINPRGETVAVAHGFHTWESPEAAALLTALKPAQVNE